MEKEVDMLYCIDCGKEISQTPDGTSICLECVEKRAAQLTPEQRRAMARVGWDALIDEATGYEKIRDKHELKNNYEKYLKEETNK